MDALRSDLALGAASLRAVAGEFEVIGYRLPGAGCHAGAAGVGGGGGAGGGPGPGGVDGDGGTAIAALAPDPHVVAIGETGLDYDRAFSPREAQLANLRRNLALALALGKPAILP